MIRCHLPQCCTSFGSVPYQSSLDRERSNVHISIQKPIFSCRNNTFRIWWRTPTGIFTPFYEIVCAWNLWSVEKIRLNKFKLKLVHQHSWPKPVYPESVNIQLQPVFLLHMHFAFRDDAPLLNTNFEQSFLRT